MGKMTHSEGYRSYAGTDSGNHSEGGYWGGSANYLRGGTCTDGSYGSHAEGLATIVQSGIGAHAEGCGSIAKGSGSHAEGGYWKSQGKDVSSMYSGGTYAGGKAAHSEGNFTSAMGNYSHS